MCDKSITSLLLNRLSHTYTSKRSTNLYLGSKASLCPNPPSRWQSEARDGPGVHPEKHSLLVSHLQTGTRCVQDRHADGQPAWHHTSQSLSGAGTAGAQTRPRRLSNRHRCVFIVLVFKKVDRTGCKRFVRVDQTKGITTVAGRHITIMLLC